MTVRFNVDGRLHDAKYNKPAKVAYILTTVARADVETKQSEQARFERIVESRPALLARSQEEPTYLNELTWEGK